MQKRVDGIVVRAPRKPRGSPAEPKMKPGKHPKKLQELGKIFSKYEFEFFKNLDITLADDLKYELSELDDPP
jgi:hypothetical protein